MHACVEFLKSRGFPGLELGVPVTYSMKVGPSIHHIFNEKLTKRNSVQYEGKSFKK